MRNLLPDDAGGDLSALCVWPDQVRHWYRYMWTGPLHFIDTPDEACSFDYSSKLINVRWWDAWIRRTVGGMDPLVSSLSPATYCTCDMQCNGMVSSLVSRGLPRPRRRQGHVRRRRHRQLHVPAAALQARQRRQEM